MCCSHSSLWSPQANTLLFSPMTPLPTFFCLCTSPSSTPKSNSHFLCDGGSNKSSLHHCLLMPHTLYCLSPIPGFLLPPPSFWLIYMKWRLPSDPEETSYSSPVHTMTCAGFVCTGVHILEFTITCIVNVPVLNYMANSLIQKKTLMTD